MAKLVDKRKLTHNTNKYRFALNFPKQTLGLPVGQHIYFKYVNEKGKNILRTYTPVSPNDQKGYVEFIIKTYPNANMSVYVDQLQIGDQIEMKGPEGEFLYRPNMVKRYGMICGGTGITPMYQLSQSILSNRKDHAKINMIFGNQTHDDIFLYEELQELKNKYPTRMEVYHILSRVCPPNWEGGQGRICKEFIQEHLPTPQEDCMILLCGPTPMARSAETLLKDLGYSRKQIFTF